MQTPPAPQTAAACVLGFDTSTELLAVALQTPHGRHATALGAGGAAASAALLPQVRTLLAQAGLGYGDLDAVAFGRGPGAFTGLRTACAVAQGIGLATGVPLLPIDSLLLVAEDARAQHAQAGDDVLVLMDARMDEVYAAHYRWNSTDTSGWQVLQPPALYTLPALQALWQASPQPMLCAGSALSVFGDRLGLPAGTERSAVEHDRAAALLRLAGRALAAGEAVDAASALPLYLRDKVALTTQEREAARRVKGLA